DDDGNVTGLDTDDAIGFGVTGGSLDLIIVTETTGLLRSWMGVAAHVDEMAVFGLPDTFELEILNLDLLFNSPASDSSKMNWHALAALPDDDFQIDGTDLANITDATNISVTG